MDSIPTRCPVLLSRRRISLSNTRFKSLGQHHQAEFGIVTHFPPFTLGGDTARCAFKGRQRTQRCSGCPLWWAAPRGSASGGRGASVPSPCGAPGWNSHNAGICSHHPAIQEQKGITSASQITDNNCQHVEERINAKSSGQRHTASTAQAA